MNDRIALSVPEAADLIGVSKSKMYEIVKREDCDFVFRIGGRTLISRLRLESWIDRQTENAS